MPTKTELIEDLAQLRDERDRLDRVLTGRNRLNDALRQERDDLRAQQEASIKALDRLGDFLAGALALATEREAERDALRARLARLLDPRPQDAEQIYGDLDPRPKRPTVHDPGCPWRLHDDTPLGICTCPGPARVHEGE